MCQTAIVRPGATQLKLLSSGSITDGKYKEDILKFTLFIFSGVLLGLTMKGNAWIHSLSVSGDLKEELILQ